MAKKSSDISENTGSMADLIKGTDFQYVTSESMMFTNRPVVSTPVYALNCLLGGGLPLGMIMEVSGPPTSGKSSACYEIIGNFQREHPDGLVIVLDSETSSDPLRLQALGVDISPGKLLYVGATTLESGFSQINTILTRIEETPKLKNIPVIIIWDTIAGSATNAQMETGKMYGGGISEAPRIIKNSLKTIFPKISNNNVLLILINQVMAEIGGWRPGMTTSGGMGLKHDIHMKMEFSGGKTSYDGIFASTKSSEIALTKSKISPLINHLPIIIDSTKGGVIDRAGSFLWLLSQYDTILINDRGWYTIAQSLIDKYSRYFNKYPDLLKRFRYDTLLQLMTNCQDVVDIFQLIWMDMIIEKYTLQSKIVEPYYNKIKTNLDGKYSIDDTVDTSTVSDIASIVSDNSSIESDESEDNESTAPDELSDNS